MNIPNSKSDSLGNNKNLQQSFIYGYFADLINTAMCFVNINFQVYLTIKNYAINFIQHSIKNQGQIYQYEQMELENHITLFNKEVFSVGGFNLAILSKEAFENFLVQSFSTINFDSCDKNTLNIANNLITVFSMYGPLSDRFSKQKQFLMFKISQLDSQIQPINHSNPVSNVNNNNNTNLNVTKVNNGNLTQTNQVNQVNTNKVNNMNEKVEIKTDPKKMNSINSANLIDRNIKLPIKKGTNEYNTIKAVIKDHLMYAEQEALYNKIDHSKAHIEAALYYLKNIIE